VSTGPGAREDGAADEPQRDAEFLDRVEEYRYLESHLGLLAADPHHLVVVGLAGLGGIGKTRFLREVRARFAALDAPPALVSVALDVPPLAALLSVRDQVAVDCHLFDVSVATYAAATEPPLPASERLLSWWSGWASARSGRRLAGEVLPVTFAVERFDHLPMDLVLRRGYDRSAFEGVDSLRSRPDELYRRLPGLLGTDVARGFKDPDRRRLVFLYDAYDEPGTDETGETAAGTAWLPEFVRSLGAGIHVVTARAPLPGDERTWGTAVQQRQLGKLPPEECRRLIRRELGDHLRRRVEDRLVSASDCNPFYLHVSVDVCRAYLRQNGSVDVMDLPSTSPGMIERLLHHLSPPARTLALALAAVQYFDASLYRELVRALDLGDAAVDIGAFVEWFFVVESDRGLFRTHDLLTDLVRRGAGMAGVARRALLAAVEHLAVRAADRHAPGYDRLPLLFAAQLEAWQQVGEVGRRVVERLVDVGYDLYDAGYWRDLAGLPGLDADRTDDPIGLVARYFSALSSRRSQGPVVSARRLEPLGPRAHLLGRHTASYDIEVAYLREISGDYPYARQRFRELDEAIVGFDGKRREHLRARLYHADVLTMDGRLLAASRLLLEAYELLGRESGLDWAELVRHRGHAHRFSLDLDIAEREYLRALRAVRDTPSMKGKLQTNLAEVLCWTEPETAVREAQEALELNARLGSRIEMAKARAALAVARSGSGDVEAAREACEQALAEADQVDYPAGRCFAHQARVVTEVRAGDAGAAARAYAELVAGVSVLTTYGHLCVVPAWFLGDRAEVRRWSADVEWIGADDLEARLRAIREP
jgi:tetratricopeptide (TPR) repeat protein